MSKIEIRKSNKKAYKTFMCNNKIKYEVINSHKRLLGGSPTLEGAMAIANKQIERLKNDKLNSHLKVWIEELNDAK